MEPTNRKIQAIVDMYLNRELLLPEMQRKYVWRATQVRDLIDSIYRDYPSGSILIWETASIPQTKDPSFQNTEQKPIGKQLLLLDGQQRVASLASVLTGLPIRIKEGTKVKEKFIDIYFNIDHPDDTSAAEDDDLFEVGDVVEAKWDEDGEFYIGKITQADGKRFYIKFDDGDEGWSDDVRTLGDESRKELFFRLKNRAIENKTHWISVTKLFNVGVGSILRDLKMGADHPSFDKYNQRLNTLYSRKDSYLYPLQIIREKNYTEVTDIFIRVNSSGTRLRGTDLALAQITSIWPGSIKQFESFVDECISKNFYVDENFLVRCMVCISTNQPKFDNVSRLTPSGLQNAWKLTKKGVQNSREFLNNNAFTDSTALLPSYFLMIPLIHYSSRHDLCSTPETEKGFLYWLYNAAIWGRYSGSSETKLGEDLACLNSSEPWISLIDNVWKMVGKDRQVTPEDIVGKGVNSPIFYMMYVIARKQQARDLETGAIVNYANFGKNNSVEFDHVFPRSKLDSFYKDKNVGGSERKRLINQIANMAFMTKKGNIIKSNDDPSIYFPKVQQKHGGTDYFERQQIPCMADLLHYESFDAFVAERSRRLADGMNEVLSSLRPACP
ncbi:MAG: DUF262 domain-containing protein [Bacteroidales bacterium]